MAASETIASARPERLTLAAFAPEALVLAAAAPILFLHVRYQPGFEVGVGSTNVGVWLSDLSILAVVAAATYAGMRRGFAPLRPALPLWIATAACFVWIAVELVVPAGSAGYATGKHTVTAAKFLEYALLAPALVLIVRRRLDLQLLLVVMTAWSVLATGVGIAQFFGADIFVSGATGGRQLSFLGFHDFGALSGAALVLGLGAIALPTLGLGRAIAWVATASGAIGLMLSASLAGIVGVAAAGAAVFLAAVVRREVDVRRLAVVAAALAVTLAGSVVMRSGDVTDYLGFLGIEKQHEEESVESYAHRTVLAWIGWQIFLDHPVAGVGWQASGEPSRYLRYVGPAHRRFPDEPKLAFPSQTRRYGVQNFYVQTLADLGIVGFLLVVAICGIGLLLAATALRRAGPPATVGLLWTLVAVGFWIAQGIVAGLPLDALTWLGLGSAAAAAAARG